MATRVRPREYLQKLPLSSPGGAFRELHGAWKQGESDTEKLWGALRQRAVAPEGQSGKEVRRGGARGG